jgi:hypothetical protein
MSGVILSNIDAIANKAIDSKMTPGIQVVAKGKVIFKNPMDITPTIKQSK